jgi:hypothetical protein
MGAAMTARLLGTGSDVSVFDLADEPVEEAVALGATRAKSVAEIAATVDIISICVPAATHIEAVFDGPNGIGEQSRDRQTILIHSTVLPDTVLWAQSLASTWGGWFTTPAWRMPDRRLSVAVSAFVRAGLNTTGDTGDDGGTQGARPSSYLTCVG